MKRKKTLLILGLVFALICIACAALLMRKKHTDMINNTDKEVFSLEDKELTKISWTYNNTSLTFEKSKKKWCDSKEKSFPVDQDQIEEFLGNFASVHASFIIKDVEDYSQYGLTNPQATITFTTKDGEDTIKIGDYSSMDSKRYITLNDKEVYLIDTDLLTYMTDDRDDFMQQSQLNTMDQVTSFEVSGDDTLHIVYDESPHTYSDDYKYYLVNGKAYKALSTENAETYIKTLTFLAPDDYVTYNATDADMSKYGLDTPCLTIEVKGNSQGDDDEVEEKSYTIHIGKKGSKYYLNKEGDKIIYHLDSDTYDTLKEADYNSLRPTEIYALDWSKVASLDFTINEKTYTVEVTQKGDAQVYKLNGKEVEFTDAKDAIDQLSITEFKKVKAEKDLEMSMTIYLTENVNGSQQSLPIEIYQYDGSSCLVLYDGKSLGLMDRSSMVTLREALQSMVLD